MSNFHSIKTVLIGLLMTFLLAVILISAVFVYLIVTPVGGKLLVDGLLNKYGHIAEISIGAYEGSIDQGFVVKDIRVSHWPQWPGATLRVQQVRAQLPLLHWDRLALDILNAWAFLPECEPVLFNGQISEGQVRGELFSRTIDVHELLKPFTEEVFSKYLSGYVAQVNLKVSGPMASPRLQGHLFVDRIKYALTTVSDAFGRLDLTFTPGLGEWQLKGEAVLDSGFVTTIRKVSLDLRPSKAIFEGDAANPKLDIHGGTRVEDIDISLAILGTLEKPQLKVTSDPPLPEDVALLVLATGKSWSSSATLLSKGGLSSEIAGDFIDYFVFGSQGGDFARQYGLSDFSMQFDDSSKRIGLQKKLVEGLKVGVELEQVPALTGESAAYSRKVGGEMRLSDHLSVNVFKKVLPQENNPAESSQRVNEEGETQLYLKYKQKF